MKKAHKSWLTIAFISAMLVTLGAWTNAIHAAQIRLGLLTADAKLGEVAQAAYDWAAKNYDSTMLIGDKGGNFRDSNGDGRQLDQFAVLWWHYSETGNLPDAFLANPTQNAIMDYLESGGALFLTALALHYTFDLGVETGADPRIFTPVGKDPPEIGVVPTAEGKNHPIFEGFDTSKPIFLCSMAQDGFTSDFFNLPDQLKGTVLGTKTRGGGAGAGERPLVEFEVGKGRIITLGHHNAVYTDTKSKEGENLRKLTANIIEYLANKSAFFAVEPDGKLATTWGKLKSPDTF